MARELGFCLHKLFLRLLLLNRPGWYSLLPENGQVTFNDVDEGALLAQKTRDLYFLPFRLLRCYESLGTAAETSLFAKKLKFGFLSQKFIFVA